MRTHALAAAAVLALALTGCGATETEKPATSATPTPERADVDWSSLPSDYQRIVDEETAEQDCTALQEMFDVAPDNGALLTYLDEALELAGCY